jgi:DNA polymerase III alpha subunit
MPRIRTGYSFRHAVGKIEDVMARLKECDYKIAPITDRASTFGWVRWAKLAEAADLRPVFGVEFAVTASINEKRPISDYWTFIAKDSLKPISNLVELATQQFRYQPLLTYEQAQDADCFKIVGHKSFINMIKPAEDLFIGVGPACSRGYLREAFAAGLQPIAVSDNKYPTAEDQGFYEVVCGRNASTQSYPQHILSQKEWEKAMPKALLSPTILRSATKNIVKIALSSTAKLKNAQLLIPDKPETLEAMCLAGAKKVGIDLTDQIYHDRLYRELALIADKAYEDYFYIVADICNFARERMIVGPARGSSCGSLVCYALGITTIDPIPYGLIFERFIDVNRDDLPDIDIDFSDQQRHLVFKYINDKYGKERCARLGTVAMYKSKSALGESGAALRIPKWKCDAVGESLIERSTGDARALNTLEDTLNETPAGKDLMEEFPEIMVAAKMEGHPRHYSQHAAGIVIAQEAVSHTIPIDHRTGATMCDKKDAEELNLLKIDALGLTQLSVFEDCLEMVGMTRDELEAIPLDDPKAFKVLNDGHFAGIFQFNGMALQSITKQFEMKTFDDIVSVTALGRPGPLASGGAHEWIRRKNGVNPVTYPHPIFEPHLCDTLGIVLFQEQVMEIGRKIGDMSWGDVTMLRKAMSKSLGVEYFDQFGDPWKKGAIAKGVNPKAANKIWDDLCAYGSWSFNKSHSVAYGMISYQCCWMKAYYPFEFAAATLSHEGDPSKQLQLLREMHDEGYTYVSIDPDRSERKWTIGEKGNERILVGPLNNVKGIGPKLVAAICGARDRGEKIPQRAQKLLANAKTPIDSLWPVHDAFERIMPDPGERNIHTAPMKVKDVQITGEEYETLVFVTLSKINPRDENEAVNIARRGGRVIEGDLTASLNLQLTDDTDTIFGKIDRWKFRDLGKPIIDRGRVGKALYAIKGKVRGDSSFRMISIKNVRYVGDIDT